MAKVYLSSGDDLRDYREAAREVLNRHGHVPVSVERDEAMQPLNVALDQIAAADLFVLIMARRLGQFVEAEYERATATSKPVLVFLLSDEARRPAKSTASDDEALLSFRSRLTKERLVISFSSLAEFTSQLADAVTRWATERPQTPTIDITLDDLPLAWRLVVGSFADPELLRHLDPSAFVAAIKKWEEANSADPAAPWPSRLDRARKALDSAQTDHEASAFWLAWMRATRPAKTTAAEPPDSGPAP